ncbi:MAG: metal-dependent transcriptional regulator [Acidimicrobiia bacterium]
MDATEYRATYREYVEAIWELEEEGIEPIQARIADWLGVSRPSVSEMMRRMEDEKLISTAGGGIRLTDEGRYLAEVVVRRHRLAERFLAEVLELPWVKVHEEASVWEHVISEDVERAMWQALNNPLTCPHGNPIPGAGYKPPKMKPVAELVAGERLAVERISEELELDQSIIDFLDTAGIRPGAELEVTAQTPDGTLTVRVDGGDHVGVGSFVSHRLFVAVP